MRSHRRPPIALVSVVLLAILPLAVGGAPATPVSSGTLRITGRHTFNLANGRFISFSPNGRWVAAQSDTALCIVALSDPKNVHCVPFSKNGPGGVDASNVRWSPDGNRLAFSEDAYRLLVNGDIWVMEAATGRVTDLTPDAYQGSLNNLLFGGTPVPNVTVNVDTNPAWSADGTTIYFTRSPLSHGFQGTYIMRIAASGGTAERIAILDPTEPGISYVGGIYPAADGKTLYFTIAHQETGDRRNGVWRINVDGTGARQIVGTQSSQLGYPILIALSSTATTGLVQYFATMSYSFAGPSFALMNMHDGTLTPLVAHGTIGTPPVFVRAVTAGFSPDGSRLVYSWSPEAGPDRQELIVRTLSSGSEEILSPSGINPLPLNLWTSGLVWARNNSILGATAPNAGFVLNLAA